MQTEEKSHLCEICGKSFRLDGSLKKHIKRHYSDYNFECYLCKHGRLSLYSLHKHMRVHVSCRKIFDFDYNLLSTNSFFISHILIFKTGVKPFKCSYCHKKFSERNNRDTHYRLHFGPTEKPHKCTVCSEAFTRPGLLSRHYMNVHGVDMPGLTAKKFIKLKR